MAYRIARQLDEARRLLAGWISRVPEQCWSDQAFGGRVYGPGYSAWGIWAQINTAFVLASSLSWPPETATQIQGPFRHRGKRKELLEDLLCYIIGSHTTGSFETVGGGRWGSRIQNLAEREHFENWHSPIWVATLAQIAIREPGLDPRLADSVWKIVSHDAEIQAALPRRFLNGRADSYERHGYFATGEGENSHPESNAWKGCLVSLARLASQRGIDPAPPSEMERTLWLSSSARPSDGASGDNWITGEPLRRYQVGTHLSDSGAIIHHGVIHPCYSVFALFSRLQTYEFAQELGGRYPDEAEHNEELIFTTLLRFILEGRIIYPAGQDWPRWIYGQCYLAPVLAHQQRKLGMDLSRYLPPAIEVLLREARDRPFRLLGRRFQYLEANHGWHYHRYEADMAYALCLAAEIIEATPTITSGFISASYDQFFDKAAETALARTNDTVVSVSSRTIDGPYQVLLATSSGIESVEWSHCGSFRVGIRDLPDLATDQSSLTSHDFLPAGGFSSTIRTLIGVSPQTDGLLELATTVHAIPFRRSVLVVQRLMVLRHTTLKYLDLHTWRFAHGQSGDRSLVFDDGQDKYEARPGEAARYEPAGPSVRLSAGPTLIIPSTHPFRWQISHSPEMTDPMAATCWTELCIPVPLDSTSRLSPGEVVCEIPLVVTYSDALAGMTFESGLLQALFDEPDS